MSEVSAFEKQGLHMYISSFLQHVFCAKNDIYKTQEYDYNNSSKIVLDPKNFWIWHTSSE